MSDERKRLDELIKLMIQERIGNMLFLTEDDDEEPISGEQLSWLDGQGSQDLERRRAEENKSFYDESEGSLPWDDRVEELGALLHGIALDVIDHYKGRPGFTKEAAKAEILASVGVPLDVFLGEQPEFGNFYSIDSLLDEEFEDVNENASNDASETAGAASEGGNDLDITDSDAEDDESKANMGDISEGYDDEEEF
jgi:hypothetical protein